MVKRPEDARLGVGQSFAFGFQHVLTLYGGAIAPPLIIGAAAGLDAAGISILLAGAMFVGGLGTMLQSWGLPFFGSQLPLVQGVSFSGVASMLVIVQGGGGLPEVFGAVLVASVVALIAVPFFAQILKFFPPIVTGIVITTIGLSLMPVGADWAAGGAALEGTADYASVENLLLAAGTLLVVLILSKSGIAILSRLAILLAIIIGTAAAAILGIADLSGVMTGEIVAAPKPFAFGAPTFAVGAILSLVIVNLVNMTEATADMLAVGEVVGTKVGRKRIADGLRSDMVSSVLAPVFNTFTQASFSQNVGLVAITGVRSRFVVTAGGFILVVMGFLPPLGRLIAAIPDPVLGGAGIVLFGSVAAAGIRILGKVRYTGNMNIVIVAASLGFGLLPVVSPEIYAQMPSWFQVIFGSGICSATLMAIVLNVVFNHWQIGKAKDAAPPAEAYLRVVSKKHLARFEEGDTIVDGRVLDADGNEVPAVDHHRYRDLVARIEAGEITDPEELERELD